NILLGNQGFGISVLSVSNSVFWGNFIRGNGEGDAREIGTANDWSSTDGIGNYWGDQANTTRATIAGGVESYDEHPLSVTEISSFPMISENSDLALTYDNETVILSWIVWTIDDTTVEINIDGIVDFTTNTFESIKVSYNLSNLTEGYHNITIAVYYAGVLHTSDTVIIFMEVSIAPIVTVLTASGLIAIVIVLEILRKRKIVTGTILEPVPVT
ncbi:MAG: hypothetical protein P1Q69_19475, partial [Candidatus Thorarchaeota archaeon]|nr:hypothetical protein [Candidatus Thorarchaeota archaeon]